MSSIPQINPNSTSTYTSSELRAMSEGRTTLEKKRRELQKSPTDDLTKKVHKDNAPSLVSRVTQRLSGNSKTSAAQNNDEVHKDDSDQEVLRTNFIQRWKGQISVSFNGLYSDIAGIIKGWKSTRECAKNIANAIRLYDALLRGKLDEVYKIAPILAQGNLESKSPEKKTLRPPSVFDSSLYKDTKENEEEEGGIEFIEMNDLLIAIRGTTGADWNVTRAAWNTGVTLYKARYRAADVMNFSKWWKLNDWRGRKGDVPTLDNLKEFIFMIKGRDIPEPNANPYLQDSYFSRPDDCDGYFDFGRDAVDRMDQYDKNLQIKNAFN